MTHYHDSKYYFLLVVLINLFPVRSLFRCTNNCNLPTFRCTAPSEPTREVAAVATHSTRGNHLVLAHAHHSAHRCQVPHRKHAAASQRLKWVRRIFGWRRPRTSATVPSCGLDARIWWWASISGSVNASLTRRLKVVRGLNGEWDLTWSIWLHLCRYCIMTHN